MFVHLNTHSIYSKMRGLLSLTDLMNITKSYGMDTLALTDVNGLFGFIRFVQHCHDSGIKAIAGVNLMTSTDEIIILVENQYGYENLCQIISSVHDNPGQDISDILKKRLSGLFMLAYNRSTLKKLHCLIPDTHLFVELRPAISEIEANRLAKEFKLEVVATSDVYFKSPSDHRYHKILRAIKHNTTIDNWDTTDCKSEQNWFRSEKDMAALFPNSLEAINNSRYLADRCKTDWTFVNTIFPGLSLKDTYHANKKLRNRVYMGAKKRYSMVDDPIQSRIEYELDMITQKGFAPYFLVVEDIINQTQSTIGRGSAAASIISYCLFITQVDPIKYNLKFERFIHPERKDMPDIDIDFPWDERDSILDYVFTKYGKKRTAMVASQVFLKSRSAVREVGKVFGLSNEEIKTITKRIRWYNSIKDLQYQVEEDPRFSNIDLNETMMQVLKDSKKIIGVLHHISVHPGGVIIVPDEIRKYVPVLMAPKGVQIVEWEKDQVEDSGLLKIDLLGNRSLGVVRDSIHYINLNYGENTARSKYLNYHQIQPLDDPKTERLMKEGRTMGIFYIESPATRQLLAKAKMVDFDHVVIYSSIIRPAANRYTNLMLSRIHGEEWSSMHQDLDFLNESYGIMVYEEQVSMAVMIMAGLGYSDAEKLRKTMSRNSMQHLVSHWGKQFSHGALRRGYSSTLINNVWDMIKSFIGYSFCKPHSASYAMLSFTCAYLKAHFPAEFLASVISNQGGFYSSYAYMSEARRFGIQILRPDINDSYFQWSGSNNKIQMGFMSIKGLKKKAVDIILDERKAGYFYSLDDFLVRVDLNLADAMALTNAGCFRIIASEFTHQEIAFKVAGFYLQNGSRKLFNRSSIKSQLTMDEKYRLELDVFGYPISVHPISKYRPLLSSRIRYARDIPNCFGQSIYLIGIYITRKESITHKSEPMQFLTLEDETDLYECVLFPESFKKFGDLLYWETLFIIRGTVEKSFGVYNIIIEKMASLQQWMQRLNQNKFLKSTYKLN